MDKKIIEDLIVAAKEAMDYAYVPYSKYPVGAALLTTDDEIITGCNIENASYGLTNCAERTALFKSVSQGKKDFKAIAVICKGEILASPCGACRQVIAEFLEQQAPVILANESGEYQLTSVRELLPGAFTPKSLSGVKHV
ncbi:cytidine deaminase [Alkalicella caledoniensis]|uniref:Cytidine deaminase n=1 Tax=Alkalicella caledoniensis TaxID=2731377 RepID=A0A7G9W4D9_ALKCA|nr:cytidine deaminase [Alkalicella caledoniensis]QNO13551.1 cytidine deaminase [Alkalicella caledoniensis]